LPYISNNIACDTSLKGSPIEQLEHKSYLLPLELCFQRIHTLSILTTYYMITQSTISDGDHLVQLPMAGPDSPMGTTLVGGEFNFD